MYIGRVSRAQIVLGPLDVIDVAENREDGIVLFLMEISSQFCESGEPRDFACYI